MRPSRFDGFVKTIFSRTSLRRGYTGQEVTKNAKKKPFYISRLTLRSLRLGERFWLFAAISKFDDLKKPGWTTQPGLYGNSKVSGGTYLFTARTKGYAKKPAPPFG